ncbi:MAG: SAM-dependent DNA methyltransferase [Olsenella uli]|nr:SAM-dependent DNA methyltransferase [Olsenella uli]
MSSQSTINQKVWSMATVLMNDGVSNSDYLEQLTYLLFLKMADEYSKPPYKRDMRIPGDCTWDTLKLKRGDELFRHYEYVLKTLGETGGTLQQIYSGAQNKISNPAILSRVITMIDAEKWSSMSSDVKGDIYEGLLQKVAEDTKSGAGQYFTPRALISAMVDCVQPQPGKTVVDPCCGSGGFLLAAKDYIEDSEHYTLDRDQRHFLRYSTFAGWEIVPSTYKLCLMNLFLHNISDFNGEPPIYRSDSLLADPGTRYDYVLTNPPFGKKSSYSFTNDEGLQEEEEGTYNRRDFWAVTSNKQLNFVQHIHTILRQDGHAAVVVPDNVLFEGGAGETVRRKLLETTNLHTILRLPTGIFYAQGVKANVIFFDNRPASPEWQTREVWIYDYRTGVHHTLKQRPMTREHLQDFVDCYKPAAIGDREETYSEENPNGRWRRFTLQEILDRDKASLDITWIKTGDDISEVQFSDLLAEIREKSDSIASAVSRLEELLGDIEE